ncbi:MAG TPA: Hsp20/alpha crystallin family protein [Symbiobacteriaceae bacterium]|nr:Hsp20/alpha crystallin family protein [Symbiobacteriaceae bacterium]
MNRPRSAPPGRELPAGPPLDLVREGDFLVLSIWLPGLRPEDFRVSLSGNRQVTVEGTAQYRHPVPREQLSLSERLYGPFSRTLQLPLPVDPAGATISFNGGVFSARLPIKASRVALTW